MKFSVRNHTYTVVGSCDDRDPGTGPGQSYGPLNTQAHSVLDGNSQAASRCFPPAALKIAESGGNLSVNAIAQTANSTANAIANAKTMAKSSLLVSYSWFERALAFFGGFKPKLAMQIVVALNLDVNDGPCGAGFTVFINNGPGGASPVPSWQSLYGISRSAADPTKLDVTRPNGIVETITNPGQLRDWPDGPTISVLHGQYDLTFEINAVATADGRVNVQLEGELFLYKP